MHPGKQEVPTCIARASVTCWRFASTQGVSAKGAGVESIVINALVNDADLEAGAALVALASQTKTAKRSARIQRDVVHKSKKVAIAAPDAI